MISTTNGNERSLDDYRDYLRMLTRLQLSPSLQSKMDVSDVVQQVILQAHAGRSQFRGQTESTWLAWLRVILANTLTTAARRHSPELDMLDRGRTLEGELEKSSSRLEQLFAADQTSPSEGAIRCEELLRLAQAINRLPDDQRLVVELHHIRGLSVAEVATELNRTGPSVVGLLIRGLRKLREQLCEPGDQKP
ncbi:MAG: sigma-70 family RNA polymerase sigma factor [Planctomycetaceae bacterium]